MQNIGFLIFYQQQSKSVIIGNILFEIYYQEQIEKTVSKNK